MKTGVIKAFKLLSCTGAYWRGSEKNKMLSRVYAIAFPKASMLDEHLKQLEEAKMRDHNKLGRELEYFTTVDVVGQGLPILLPKGARVDTAVTALGRRCGTVQGLPADQNTADGKTGIL